MMWLAMTLLLSSFGEPLVAAETAASEELGTEFFERKVRPLLVQHCFSCHARGQKKGGLSLANRAGLLAGGDSGAVVALGKPGESSLIAAVEQTGDVQMPPNGKLSKDEIATLRKWIELGAPWPESATKDGGGIRAAGTITEEDRQFWSFRQVRAIGREGRNVAASRDGSIRTRSIGSSGIETGRGSGSSHAHSASDV
jgi:cytochrome c551/c552